VVRSAAFFKRLVRPAWTAPDAPGRSIVDQSAGESSIKAP
jgi:hypothetical protein